MRDPFQVLFTPRSKAKLGAMDKEFLKSGRILENFCKQINF